MGVYKEIFKKAGSLIKKGAGKTKTKKNKPMKKIKLSPDQKARLKGAGKKALDYVQSGKLATVTGQATRYSQGKPVVIKRSLTKEEKQSIPDTVSFLGYQIPKTYAYLGGGLAVLGIGYLATHRK
jgi:hypothetical protein